jgi:hypothetical protein
MTGRPTTVARTKSCISEGRQAGLVGCGGWFGGSPRLEAVVPVADATQLPSHKVSILTTQASYPPARVCRISRVIGMVGHQSGKPGTSQDPSSQAAKIDTRDS